MDPAAPQLITGTALADSLNGRFGDDVIDGLAGNDTIDGQAGSDVIQGGEGMMSLTGTSATTFSMAMLVMTSLPTIKAPIPFTVVLAMTG